jgi:hypothetical protein
MIAGAGGALDRGVAKKYAMLPRLLFVLDHCRHQLLGRRLLSDGGKAGRQQER